MPIHDKYFTGSSVSRYLSPGERAFEEVVYQSGKPPLDSEFNLEPDIVGEARSILLNATTTSGWLRGPLEPPVETIGTVDSFLGFAFPPAADPNFAVDSFLMQKAVALVAGRAIVVEYANFDTAGWNRIQLDAAPVFGGAPPDVKRTDFVFLEVFLALVSESPNATGTITITANPTLAGDNFNIAGNTLTGVLGAPGVDQYQVGANSTLTAANIAAAINSSPPNSFTNVTATAVGAVVTIRAVVAGAAGNALALTQTGVAGGGTYTLSGATLSGGADTPNKPTQDTLYRHGNVDSSTAVDLPDDIEDPIVAVETSKRVQIQYRIRATGQTEAVNFKTQQDGFSNPNVLAQGTQAAPVATYPFVRADNSTVSGNSDATAYGYQDPGLWVAGDGSSVAAAALGTVDGFVYAIPIAFVFRRNDASGGVGWDPLNNTNGALSQTHGIFAHPILGPIPANTSDRPDGKFHDEITEGDVLDLRRHVVPAGMDWSTEMRRQVQFLMDGQLRSWAIDTSDKQDLGAGSGDVSYLHLVCDEVGRDSGEGGTPPASGDTNRGVTIANFDHVRRRFADQPVVEKVLLALYPTDAVGVEPGKYNTQANGGYAGWAENDEINIDLGALNATGIGDFSDASKTFSGGAGGGTISGLWPSGTTVTNLLRITHDDGHYTTAVSQEVQTKLVSGMGTDHIKIVLDRNDDTVNGGDSGNPNYRMVGDSGTDDGSPRRIFVELEITYPLGSGTTNTVDYEVVPATAVYTKGPVLENDTSQRPVDFEELEPVRFRTGRREVHLEYVANDGSGVGSGTPITDTFVSMSTSQIRTARRIFGSGSTVIGVTDISTLGAGAPHDVDTSTTEYGSSSRLLVLDTSGPAPKIPLSGAGQTLVSVEYFAQDAVPNYGAAGGGYQVATYYRSVAPQTAGIKAGALSLPATLTVRVLSMSQDVWSSTVGPGSTDDAFPYTVPMDQIPVNGDVLVTDFPAEWYFAATGQISVDDFSADTGLVNLHAMVPVDGTGQFTFSSPDSDPEFRAAYKVSDTTAYRPTIFTQPLSSVQRHKVWAPMLAVATEDDEMWRKGEVLLLVVTRFAALDDENTIRFTDSGNTTCVGVYRTRGMFLVAGS